MGVALLFICFSLSVSKGVYHPSFTSLSGIGETARVNVVDDAVIFCGNAAESLVAIFQVDRMPAAMMLLGCGLVGLAGYGRKRLKK